MEIKMNANALLTLFWLGLAGGVLMPGVWLLINGQCRIRIIELILQRFYLFGKLKNEDKNKKQFFTDVPKAYFRHFYLLGLLVNIPLILFSGDASLLFSLFLIHLCRRLYECYYVHQFGARSTMSFIHYLVGLIHYPFVGLTILVDHQSPAKNCFPLTGLIFFVLGSYFQYQAHLTLAHTPRNSAEYYPIPTGFWLFEYLSCPNYFAEIMIYFSFFCLSHRTAAFLSLLIWVIVNQSLSALLAHRWYCQHYGAHYPPRRRALLPFIL